ncbi:uncharacterized protein [Mytilus edulis]|uniref:uncharacterized protein n=1 Tax=Mytilus edulis TaxID=6550 RepID=UPI0039EE42AD
MWWLALTIITLLNDYLVYAKFFLNSSKVTWIDAQQLCNVPFVGDIMYTQRDFSELPETFTAWTSSRNLTSDWTSFYGCLDVPVKMVSIKDTKQTLNQYFPDSVPAVESNTVFKCAYFCTAKSDVFTFFNNICKCIYKTELKSQLVQIPVCIFFDSTKMENVDDAYSLSRRSLPIFKFETDLRNKMIQNGEGIPHKHHCLAKTNGSFTTNDCNSTKKFTCDGPGGFHGFGTWTTAIYNCIVNGSFLKKKSDKSDHWLRYFKYEEGM